MSQPQYTGLLRYYIDPSDDIQERTDALATFCEETHLAGVMLFTASHEKQPWVLTREEANVYIVAMSEAAAMLRKRELIVDVNIITTLGHDDEGVPREGAPLDFTHMVDATGEESIGIVCPLDPDFQHHFCWFVAEIAQHLSPRVIWIDDDFRYTWHPPRLYLGCFCDRHRALFASALGTSTSREEIVNRLFLAEDVERRKYGMATYASVLRQTIEEFAGSVRASVDSVAPGVRVGYMGNGPDEDWRSGIRYPTMTAAFGGDTRPALRPHLRLYRDGERRDLPMALDPTFMTAAMAGPRPEIVTEIDGHWPHSLFHRSAATVTNAVSAAAFNGIASHSFFLYGFGTIPFTENPEYRQALKNLEPFVNRILTETEGLAHPSGVHVPYIGSAMCAVGPEKIACEAPAFLCADRSWVHTLSVLGLPVTYDDVGPVVLPADHADGIDRSDLEGFIARGLFMNGRAAEKLVRRGFGPLIGVEQLQPLESTVTAELVGDERIIVGPGVTSRDHFYKIVPMDGARELSSLMEYWSNKCGAGLVAFENANGGRVAITAYGRSGKAMPVVHETALRRNLMVEALEWLGRCELPGFVVDRPAHWLQIRGAGARRAIMVTNLTFDRTRTVKLALGDLPPGRYRIRGFKCGERNTGLDSALNHTGGRAVLTLAGTIEPQESTLYVIET